MTIGFNDLGRQGRLGNQMFQIAAAVALAKRNNDDYGFNFYDCFTPQQGNTSDNYINNIFKKIQTISDFPFESTYQEPFFAFNELPPLNVDLEFIVVFNGIAENCPDNFGEPSHPADVLII